MVTADRPGLLVLTGLPEDTRARLAGRYAITHAFGATGIEAIGAAEAAGIRAVLTNGSIGLSDAMMADLPALELICVRGAGHENVDVTAAHRRGIAVTSGAGCNASTVADHAMALLLSVVRALPRASASLHAGGWKRGLPLQPIIAGGRLGILGLGMIGGGIARRAAAGFGMDVAYHSRNRRDDVDYAYCGSLHELAIRSDFLVIAAPGGAATRHVVNAEILAALGPRGYLVNVGRGSIVDTAALVRALREGTIAGAGLDVFEDEPEVPAELMALPNTLLTPHVAGRSTESHAATLDRIVGNLDAHFAGRPLTMQLLPHPQAGPAA